MEDLEALGGQEEDFVLPKLLNTDTANHGKSQVSNHALVAEIGWDDGDAQIKV